jgi:hypothetical protein
VRFTEARERILSTLYVAAQGPDVWIDRDAFLRTNFSDAEREVADTVLRNMEEKAQIKRRREEIALSVDGCYEAEKVMSDAHYPKPERASNQIAILSLAVGIYVTIVVFLTSYFDGLINNSCMMESAIHYGGRWEPICEWFAVRNSPDQTAVGRLVTNPLFWAVVLAAPLVIAIIKLRRAYGLQRFGQARSSGLQGR